MFTIGCHLSCSKGFYAMGKDALRINANTFQFFTRNPRGSKAKPVDPADANALLALMREYNFPIILAHAPYTLNPCSDKASNVELAAELMADDLARMEYLPHNLYNFHPGSHVGQGAEKGIELISNLLNNILTSEQRTTVLLETMSGKGSEVGGTFEELQEILSRVHHSEKMGVCLDTCHVFDAGYNIVDELEKTLEHFDTCIGLDKLKAIHLNDSLNTLASHKDRHSVIGGGNIGKNALAAVINHPKLAHLPFFLETPHDSLQGYADEIAMLRGLRTA